MNKFLNIRGGDYKCAKFRFVAQSSNEFRVGDKFASKSPKISCQNTPPKSELKKFVFLKLFCHLSGTEIFSN